MTGAGLALRWRVARSCVQTTMALLMMMGLGCGLGDRPAPAPAEPPAPAPAEPAPVPAEPAPARLEALLRDVCADGVEANHERLANPKPKEPVTVEVDTDQWRLVVIHADSRCTSDDWSWYTHEVREWLTAQNVPAVYAGAEHGSVVIQRAGAELARFPLEGQGYALFAAGRPPEEVEHNVGSEVRAQIARSFGLPVEPR